MINQPQFRPHLLNPGTGPTLSFLGIDLAYKVSSADNAGAWALLEYVAPPRFVGPPLHWHKVTTEAFYVLEGTVTFRVGEEVFIGKPGALVYIPTSVLHTFSNQEDGPARFLTFLSPGGFEDYFKELTVLVQSESIWPPQDMSRLFALYAKYDNYFPEK